MTRTRLLFYLALVFVLRLSAQSPFHADTLPNIAWEQLQGPPTSISQYAQWNNRVFAASANGLFQTDNFGQSWYPNPSFKGAQIREVVVMDDVVIVTQDRVVSTGYCMANQYMDMFRSADGGNTFAKVLSLDRSYQGTSTMRYVTGLQKKNNTTLCIGWKKTNGNAQPTEITYYSNDKGATWLTRIGLYRDVYAITQDTLFGYDFTYVGSIAKVRLAFASNNNFLNYVSGTISLPIASGQLPQVFYKKGILFAFYRDTKQVFRSNNKGATWSAPATVQLPNKTILNVSLSENDRFYFTQTNGVHYAFVDAPTQTTQMTDFPPNQYGGLNLVFTLPSGWWLCDAYQQSRFSTDMGKTWLNRSNGIVGPSYDLMQWCDRIVVNNGSNYNTGHYYRTIDGSSMELGMLDSTYTNKPYFAEVNGRIIGRKKNGTYWRSADCGSTWSPVAKLTFGNHIGFFTHGNRLYVWGYPNKWELWKTDDAGDSWQKLPQNPVASNESIGSLYAAGDTLFVAARSNTATGSYLLISKIYYSTNKGQTWSTIAIPQESQLINLWRYQGKWYAQGATYNSNFAFLTSTDNGKSWIQTCYDFLKYGQTSSTSKTIPVLFHEGKLFVHAANGLYVTGNDGVNWTRIGELPFKKDYYVSNGSAEMLQGGNDYLIKDGYLYAATNTNGLLRTPLQAIFDHVAKYHLPYGVIAGLAFHEKVVDCAFQSGESKLSNLRFTLEPGTYTATSNTAGIFNFAAPPGHYVLKTSPVDTTLAVCPQYVDQAVDLLAGAVTNALVPIHIKPNIKDIACGLFPKNPVKPGKTFNLALNISNNGSVALDSVHLHIQVDPTLMELAPSFINGTVTNLGSDIFITAPLAIQPYGYQYLFVEMMVSSDAMTGTEYEILLETPWAGDVKPYNNSASWFGTIGSSFLKSNNSDPSLPDEGMTRASTAQERSAQPEAAQLNTLRVFPNPSSTQCNVAWPVDAGVLHWAVYDDQGRLVQSGQNTTTPLELDTHAWESGIFTLQAWTAAQRWNRKIVVLR